MIIDTINQLKKYTNIPYADKITSFLDRADILAIPKGDYPILGKDLYVKVLRYVPQKAEENNFEIHNVYSDIQIIIDGVEIIQIAPFACLREKTDYDSNGDFQFFAVDKYISDIVVQKGQFIVFFPREIHRPGCLYKNLDRPVMKLVFKSIYEYPLYE